MTVPNTGAGLEPSPKLIFATAKRIARKNKATATVFRNNFEMLLCCRWGPMPGSTTPLGAADTRTQTRNGES